MLLNPTWPWVHLDIICFEFGKIWYGWVWFGFGQDALEIYIRAGSTLQPSWGMHHCALFLLDFNMIPVVFSKAILGPERGVNSQRTVVFLF